MEIRVRAYLVGFIGFGEIMLEVGESNVRIMIGVLKKILRVDGDEFGEGLWVRFRDWRSKMR